MSQNTVKKRRLFFIALAALLHAALLVAFNFNEEPIQVSLDLSQLETQLSFYQELEKSQVIQKKPPKKLAKKKPLRKKMTAQAKRSPAKKSLPKPASSRAQASSPMVNQEEIQKYLRKVIFKLERNKYYPRLAPENGEEGLLRIEIILDRQGRLKNYRFLKKTSHPRLNQAAERALKRAGSFGSLPSSYGGESLSLQVPIRFVLAS